MCVWGVLKVADFSGTGTAPEIHASEAPAGLLWRVHVRTEPGRVRATGVRVRAGHGWPKVGIADPRTDWGTLSQEHPTTRARSRRVRAGAVTNRTGLRAGPRGPFRAWTTRATLARTRAGSVTGPRKTCANPGGTRTRSVPVRAGAVRDRTGSARLLTERGLEATEPGSGRPRVLGDPAVAATVSVRSEPPGPSSPAPGSRPSRSRPRFVPAGRRSVPSPPRQTEVFSRVRTVPDRKGGVFEKSRSKEGIVPPVHTLLAPRRGDKTRM